MLRPELNARIITLLRQLDAETLHGLAGQTVVQAVRSVFQTNVEAELAAIVFLRYGTSLLQNKRIRLAIIDTLPSGLVQSLCDQLAISAESHIERHVGLNRYFESYNPERSKVLADALGLDSDFYLHPTYDTRTEVEIIDNSGPQTLTPKPFLHEYQKRVKDQVVTQLGEDSTRFVVQMPTGAGKTYTALEAVVDFKRRPHNSDFVVWLVDSNELCEQALASFRSLWALKGDSPLAAFRLFAQFEPSFSNYSGGVVFAGFDKIHSIISNPQHPAYASVSRLISQCGLLIVDEAHASIATTREACINAFIARSSATIVGLTATPARADPTETEALARLYQGKLITLVDQENKTLPDPIGYLQQEGYLARVHLTPLATASTIDESNESRVLESLARDHARNLQILEQLRVAHDARESTLVFACTKEHVFALRVLCKSQDIPVEHITGEVPQSHRIEILERFRNRQFFILLNLDILSTGIDVPGVNKLIITRPIGSRILYSQILGRALRGPRNGGNPENTVINLKDNLSSFPGANLLYDWFAREFEQ